MLINGRSGKINPRTCDAGVVSDDNGVTIRLDDRFNPEFWLEIRISREELIDMYLQVEDLHDQRIEGEHDGSMA